MWYVKLKVLHSSWLAYLAHASAGGRGGLEAGAGRVPAQHETCLIEKYWCLTAVPMKTWRMRAQEGKEGFKPVPAGFRLEGSAGSLVAHVGCVRERGRQFALLSLAAGEAFPEGLLEGAAFHWGVASREGGAWAPPPDGWQADPSDTADSGEIFSGPPMQPTSLRLRKPIFALIQLPVFLQQCSKCAFG